MDWKNPLLLGVQHPNRKKIRNYAKIGLHGVTKTLNDINLENLCGRDMFQKLSICIKIGECQQGIYCKGSLL